MVSVPCIVDNSNGLFLFYSLQKKKFRIVSVRFETVLFVSVVSIKVRNTETNRKTPFFGFTKQTETNAKQILFRFVSVRTEKLYFSFRGHPRCGVVQLVVRGLAIRQSRCQFSARHGTPGRFFPLS